MGKKRSGGSPGRGGRVFPRTTLAVVFFLSGMAGLGYEVVWGRWLHSVFGASAWALAAILSAFMAGLALGSWSLPWCDYGSFRSKAGVEAYAEVPRLLGFWTPDEVFSAYVGRLATFREQFRGAGAE